MVTSPSWVEVNLDAIQYNIQQVDKRLDSNTKIMAIVKANAYGHGAVEVAKEVLNGGVNYLGVATVNEGVKLRQANIKAPILILGTTFSQQVTDVVKYDLTPTVYTYQLAEQLSKKGQEVKIHLNLDTGMGRIGLRSDETIEKIKKIAKLSNVKIEGIFTHFAKADTDLDYTKKQLNEFKAVVNQLEKQGIKIPIKHTANSAAIVNYSASHYNLVRMGLVLYGLYPRPELADKIELKAALSWKARIAHLKEVPAGVSISYGGRYITSTTTKVATLPLGYHDGYSRKLSGVGDILYQGQRYPVIGRVCMDQLMVDMTGAQAAIGDVVTLLGSAGEEEISANELADKIGTINYEVISRIGPRVPRVFYKQGEIKEAKLWKS
ncbi:alanine racemase [Halobacteroides halobius DSM 5150]|uniref:Alanine racemase n=1 Tax=Halobacteroides halobius (strain ATCC 35273 / DSM 5150 / MD-1) TaxID=748449 RepID=L0KBV0_HALHC|nr:alanine racemase [Halobacteroides halobius]AGB42486.1 alanine racemase [Halobacteroides halobius DSM 5150]